MVQSGHYDFNIRRLDRYLIMVNESNIEPVILLSKRDLISDDIMKQRTSDIDSMNNTYVTIAFSNTTGEKLDDIKNLISGCPTCNISMNTKNFYEFKKEYGFDKIDDNIFTSMLNKCKIS